MNFVRPEDAALAPIGQKAPRVAVAGTCRVRLPRALELFAPAGLKLLVEVDAAANIGVLWDELQRFAARDIEAPRRNNLLLDCAPRALSFSTVSSVDPVSSTQMSSASDIESMKRSTNCDSFLQMA
ncbi:MAG: hypothetical protein ACLRSD_13110 [Oscillibacter sp.]